MSKITFPPVSSLSHSTSWNTLMSIMEQIEGLGYNIKLWDFPVNDHYVNGVLTPMTAYLTQVFVPNVPIFGETSTNLKEATLKCCIMFIDWYNQNH